MGLPCSQIVWTVTYNLVGQSLLLNGPKKYWKAANGMSLSFASIRKFLFLTGWIRHTVEQRPLDCPSDIDRKNKINQRSHSYEKMIQMFFFKFSYTWKKKEQFFCSDFDVYLYVSHGYFVIQY